MDSNKDHLPKIGIEGAGILLIDAAGARFSDAIQGKIRALSHALKRIAGVSETVPGMNNLMVVFDPLSLDPEALEADIRLRWEDLAEEPATGAIVDVPVVYGGPGGEDLAVLAAEKGMTPGELVALHSTAVYGVAAVGAMPGFVYLSGLDPVLATPRRAHPRMAVAKGSVIVGGQQAGIMPVTAPSGWHILGHTGYPLFDPHREPPAAFRPGDRIRFVVEAIL